MDDGTSRQAAAHSELAGAATASSTGGGPGAETQTSVTIGFRPDLISRWEGSGTAPDLLLELGDQLVALGFSLRQLHPGAADVQLASWFEVSTPSPQEANRVVAYLRGHPAVVAAYVKPTDALPG